MVTVLRQVLAYLIDTEIVPEKMPYRNFKKLVEGDCFELITDENTNEVSAFIEKVWHYCKSRDEQGAVLTQLDYTDIVDTSVKEQV